MTEHHDPAETASTIRVLTLDIRDLYNELPDTIAHIAGLHATTYTPRTTGTRNTHLTGGDALALALPGTTNTVTSSRTGNRDHAADNLPTDPPSVYAVLTNLEDSWRTQQHQPAATHTNTTDAANYLIANATWAAHHAATLTDDITNLRTLRARLLAVTGRHNHPRPSDAPCIDCNGTVVQTYGPRGLDDQRECHRCGKTYTPTQYALAVQARIDAVRDDPDRLLTATEARTLWRLSEKQIYTWEHRGKLTPAAHDKRGHRLYRNADIATLKRRTTPM